MHTCLQRTDFNSDSASRKTGKRSLKQSVSLQTPRQFTLPRRIFIAFQALHTARKVSQFAKCLKPGRQFDNCRIFHMIFI